MAIREGVLQTVKVRTRFENVENVQRNVEHEIRCDRLNDRKRFRETIESEKDFDVIVDFVAFSEENVRDVIVSTKKTCHYIFISTDSVHMACLPPKDARRALREDDAVLGAKLPKKLRKIRGSYQIQYGLSKLQAEQYLRDEAKDRYTVLRYRFTTIFISLHSTTASNTHSDFQTFSVHTTIKTDSSTRYKN